MIYNTIDIGSAFVGIGVFFLLIMMGGLMLSYYVPTNSKRYRKYLTNLFVCAKIREYATKEKVDLSKEELEFLKYISSNNKDRIRELDDKIEAELMGKINDTKKKE